MSTPASHETPDHGSYEGDPALQQHKWVDSTGYVPPWMQTDAFTKAARTYADVTIEEVNDPNYIAAVNLPGAPAGESEFSWGLGNANSLSKGPGPNPLEILKATQRTNPADPTDTYQVHLTDPGWAQP